MHEGPKTLKLLASPAELVSVVLLACFTLEPHARLRPPGTKRDRIPLYCEVLCIRICYMNLKPFGVHVVLKVLAILKTSAGEAAILWLHVWVVRLLR